MLKNYFITAYRNLSRNKANTLINVLGLTLGITCFTLIFLHTENELSHDSFHENESYRYLLDEQSGDGETRTYGVVGVKTLNTIADNVAGIKDVILVRNHGAGPLLVEYKDVKYKSRDMFFAEPDFFDYFDFTLLQGNPETALANPNNVILTQSTAKKIFGNANPMGEFIKYSGGMNFTLQVTGVVEDPENSHIDFDFLMNFDLKDDSGYIIMREGFANSVYGYFKFEEGVRANEVATRTKAYFKDFYKDQSDILGLLEREQYQFQSIYDIYFGSNDVTFDDGLKKGDKQNVFILAGIGFFILLIGCMNYVNAATAKAINRSKEIGVRKVFGAFRSQLVVQFMGEAFIVTSIAVLFSILLTDITLPYFENLVGTSMRYSLLENSIYIPLLLAILISVTVLSGLYPALILSSFRPSDSLKSQSGKKLLKGNVFRSFLISIQLVFAIMLISAVLLIVKQTKFMNEMELGFSKENILIIPNNSQLVGDKQSTFKEELLRSPYIEQASVSMDVLGFGSTNNSGRVILEGESEEQAPVASFFTVGMDFIDLQGIKIIEGRSFNQQLSTDSVAIVVNEAFVRASGSNDILNQRVRLWSKNGELKPVIGVVEDFNFKSLHAKVSPAIFVINKNSNWFWTLKIDPDHKKEVLAHSKATWESIDPTFPFGYMFLEDNLNDFYQDEKRLQSAIQVFGILCVIISCLGLYGMTAFVIEQKLKEIGIRKVLGAKVKQLVWIINQRFVALVIIATAIALPIVYYVIDIWLSGFAYHIQIGFGSFLLTIWIVLMIVSLTVSWQAIRASLSNPAKVLSSE